MKNKTGTISTARCHGKQVNLRLDPALVKKMDNLSLPGGGGRAVKIEAGIRLWIESICEGPGARDVKTTTAQQNLDMAEQQMTGFLAHRDGDSVDMLISAMGLTQGEWKQISKDWTDGYREDFSQEVDEYFERILGKALVCDSTPEGIMCRGCPDCEGMNTKAQSPEPRADCSIRQGAQDKGII